VQIVYRDECEIIVSRRVCTAQSARPNTERQ
jgi:hypothetical protein